MEQNSIDSFSPILDSLKYHPCISLLMPFEPKMGLKKELGYQLKIASDKIEKEIAASYPSDKAEAIMDKLHKVIDGLNFNTHKKSIAIFVSPLIEKVYYLDMLIDEKIIIDDSFEIRDLIYSKTQAHKYLLVVLSSKWTKIFIGNTTHFIRITSNVPDNIEAFKNDIPEKVANFSDENKRKEILLNKFLKHTDNGLSLLLQSYKLPLFIMGTIKTIGHFKAITHNAKNVIHYIHGNFEDKSEAEFKEIMKPYLTDWKKINQSGLFKQIDDAMSRKKLVYGIEEVWKSALEKKGRMLIVEKNFIFPADHSSNPEMISKHQDVIKNSFYIKDAVDDIIEKVIACGGDVEFVDEGVLESYSKIAMIEYF